MGAMTTVIFSDLTGSTGVFEALGNEKATLAVTRLTHLMGETCVTHHGRVVKTLGDGVLALFDREADAIAAMVDLQRSHQARIANWPRKLLMHIKIGAACGELVEVASDCYGDAVNLASRLCDLAGPGEIWVSRNVVQSLHPGGGVRFRGLGRLTIRGMTDAREVCQVDWNHNDKAGLMTVPAPLAGLDAREEPILGHISLSWLDQEATFSSSDLPIHLGRLSDVEFAVNDPRVSRRHARIDWVSNNFVLTDLSSYGTWVRFEGGPSELALRRSECVLMGHGEISLGAPFTDFTAPTLSFTLSDGAVMKASPGQT